MACRTKEWPNKVIVVCVVVQLGCRLAKCSLSTVRIGIWRLQQDEPTLMYDAGSRNETRATLVGGEHSDHLCAPSPLLPQR